jgi:hypothetical protein
MSRTCVAALAALLLLAACSSPADTGAQPPPVASEAAPTIEPGDAGSGQDHGGFGARRSNGGGGDGGTGGEVGGDGGSRAGGGDGGGSGGPPGAGGSGDSERGTGPASAAYPAAGAYVYAQKGSEAFCDPSGSCERHRLPPTQRISTSHAQRTRSEAMVVTEVESSNGRYVRTTMHFTPDAGFVTQVYYRLVYEGLTLHEQYDPDPPVPQFRFPLKVGREWDASWKAGTSGDYHARVTDVENVDVGERSVEAFRIETLTNFRGDLKGRGSIVVWFDAATRAIVRTNGALNLEASYGSYNTNFRTTLKSAPGY